MVKVIFEDESRVSALSGKIISEDGFFITLEQPDRIIKISKQRIIKIEQSKGDSDAY